MLERILRDIKISEEAAMNQPEHKVTGKVVVLARKLLGVPTFDDFRVEKRELPSLRDNEVMFKSLYISPDPYQRVALESAKEGDLVPGSSVGEVIQSKHPCFQPGDIIVPYKGWVSHGILSEQECKTVLKHNPEYGPPSTALGVLGMPGMTAYFGLLRICNPKQGEVVVVSGAAGAVGSIVGQIAKIQGCKVIGFAGSNEKCNYLKSIGYDEVCNYKTTKSLSQWMEEVCPNGVDCFFDNVGGEVQDVVLQNLAVGARIALCGQISQYNVIDKTAEKGPRLLFNLVYKNAKMEGFIVHRFVKEWPEALKQMAQWIKEGKIKYRETIEEGGIEVTPKAFISLFTGGNIGKQLVKLTSPTA